MQYGNIYEEDLDELFFYGDKTTADKVLSKIDIQDIVAFIVESESTENLIKQMAKEM